MDAAVKDFIHRLQLEIVRSSLHHRRRTGAAVPVVLFLTGGGSLLPGLSTMLAEQLQLPVEIYDPVRHVSMASDAVADADSARTSLASLVGLASVLTADEATRINLRPPSSNERSSSQRPGRFLAAAATLCALSFLPAAGYFHQRALRFQDEAAQIDRHIAPLRQAQALNLERLAQIERFREQIAALERTLALKTSWEDFLNDLQTRLSQVGDVWLDRLTILPAGATPAGVRSALGNRTGEAQSPTSLAPRRLAVSGRLLDVAQPLSKVSPEAVARVKRLLLSFADSAFVASVEHERFDSTQPGLLRFDVTLMLNARWPL